MQADVYVYRQVQFTVSWLNLLTTAAGTIHISAKAMVRHPQPWVRPVAPMNGLAWAGKVSSLCFSCEWSRGESNPNWTGFGVSFCQLAQPFNHGCRDNPYQRWYGLSLQQWLKGWASWHLHAYTSNAQRTAVWALARVIDASWCICIRKVLLFEL